MQNYYKKIMISKLWEKFPPDAYISLQSIKFSMDSSENEMFKRYPNSYVIVRTIVFLII